MRTIRIQGRLTPKKALDAFAKKLAHDDASATTRTGYLHDVAGFFAWYGTVEGRRSPIRSVVEMDIGSYRDHLLDVDRLKASTVNRKLQALRRFYRFAVEAKWRKEDPTRKTKSVRTEKRMRPVALSKAETTALLRAASQTPRGLGIRNYALIQFMLQTGLRVDEVQRLRAGDVALQERSGSLTFVGKGRRERTVPLNAAARRGLSRYLESRGEELDDDAPLFASERGSKLSLRSIQHAVSATAERGGIKHAVAPHVLRHTFAIRFLEDNPNQLVMLSELLGHESLDTTAIYVRPTADDVARRLERES